MRFSEQKIGKLATGPVITDYRSTRPGGFSTSICLRECGQKVQRASRRHSSLQYQSPLTDPVVADATAGRSSALGESLAPIVARQINQANASIPDSRGLLKSANSEWELSPSDRPH